MPPTHAADTSVLVALAATGHIFIDPLVSLFKFKGEKTIFHLVIDDFLDIDCSLDERKNSLNSKVS